MIGKSQQFLTAAQLRERYGNVSHMWIERRLQRDPNFPRPIKLGGSSIRLWDVEAIEAYERAAVSRALR
jgi:predicted DNA-binding transcriptional regulator AlpA